MDLSLLLQLLPNSSAYQSQAEMWVKEHPSNSPVVEILADRNPSSTFCSERLITEPIRMRHFTESCPTPAPADRHSREGSYDRGRSFMNQIYMDTEQLQKLRARQENHPPTSNHGNREVMGARDSGYPGPERPRWGVTAHILVFLWFSEITGSVFQGS